MDLFDTIRDGAEIKPLAERMRANTLKEFLGQEHIVSESSLLNRAIRLDRLGSCIFWGPPGAAKPRSPISSPTGRTGSVIRLNAVNSGVADVKAAVDRAKNDYKLYGKKTYLLLDECHRFSKTQSDSLLPAVDIGAYLVQT